MTTDPGSYEWWGWRGTRVAERDPWDDPPWCPGCGEREDECTCGLEETR